MSMSCESGCLIRMPCREAVSMKNSVFVQGGFFQSLHGRIPLSRGSDCVTAA